MAKKAERRLPAGTAGLTRYYEESPETLRLKPEQVVGIIVALVVLEIFLYLYL
jgi:preprotein translocase subunit Sec61beta